MKKNYIFLLGLTMLVLQSAFSRADNTFTLKEQLLKANKYWQDKNCDAPIFQDNIPLMNTVLLIQTHLSFVEQKLRDKNIDNLTTQQRENRNKCLNILHNYWSQGVFPMHLFYETKTPFFIDNFGTACAVGQLIISTGHAEFAKKISRENNYAYITELNEKYLEIKIWADEYGFEIDELAWIQPMCYTTCSSPPSGTKKNVSCYGGNDGEYRPVISTSGLPFPYIYNFYYWNSNQWFEDNCHPGCELIAGIYKWELIDGAGNMHDYIDTITQPDSIYAVKSSTNDNGSCNGTATANTFGGVAPYTFAWSPSGQTNQTATGLCQGIHTVTITDVNACTKVDSITVNFATGINENKNFSFDLFPNPANEKLFIQISVLTTNSTTLTIYNALGEPVLTKKIIDKSSVIDISAVNNGVYFITLDNGHLTSRQKIMKNGSQGL
jgi:hypothetical protein